jgi:hypothetical protein
MLVVYAVLLAHKVFKAHRARQVLQEQLVHRDLQGQLALQVLRVIKAIREIQV